MFYFLQGDLKIFFSFPVLKLFIICFDTKITGYFHIFSHRGFQFFKIYYFLLRTVLNRFPQLIFFVMNQVKIKRLGGGGFFARIKFRQRLNKFIMFLVCLFTTLGQVRFIYIEYWVAPQGQSTEVIGIKDQAPLLIYNINIGRRRGKGKEMLYGP